jgi:hypothetical protein
MSFKWLLNFLLVLSGLLIYFHDEIPTWNSSGDSEVDHLEDKPKPRGEPSTDPGSK